MQATSTWQIAPELAKALTSGVSAGAWIGGRIPVCSYAQINPAEPAAGAARQHTGNSAAADGLNWVVVARYTDTHLSAGDPGVRRPAFLTMLRDLRAGHTPEGVPVQGIVAAAEDRVRRLPQDALRVRRALSAAPGGGCFLAADDKRHLEVHSDGAQATGHFAAQLTAQATAQVAGQTTGQSAPQFLAQPVPQPTAQPVPQPTSPGSGARGSAGPSARAVRGAAERAKEGRQSGGHRRFGWLPADARAGRPHNHLLDPVESAYLRQAVERIMAGQSERTVTQWLIAEQVPTVKGGKWTGTTVRNMVSNPAICGYRMLAGEPVLDPRTGEPVVGGWETVATPDEWRTVLRRYTGYHKVNADTLRGDPARGGTPAPRRKEVRQTRKYRLSGYLRCGRMNLSGEICTSTLVGNPVTPRAPHGAYSCNSANCRGLSRRMDMVDEAIIEIVLQTLSGRYATRARETGPWPGQGALDATAERKRLLKAAYAAGTVRPADFFQLLPELDARIEESETERGAFLAGREAGNLLAGFQRERWEEFDLRQQRIAIGTVIEAVVVKPIPPGRSSRAPFDPALLEVVWRAEE